MLHDSRSDVSRLELRSDYDCPLLAWRYREELHAHFVQLEKSIAFRIGNVLRLKGEEPSRAEECLRKLEVFAADQSVVSVGIFAQGVLASQSRLGIHADWLREFTASLIGKIHKRLTASKLFLMNHFRDWLSDLIVMSATARCEEIIDERWAAGDVWAYDAGTAAATWPELVLGWEGYKEEHGIAPEREGKIREMDIRGFLAERISVPFEAVSWADIRLAAQDLCLHYGAIVVVPEMKKEEPSPRKPVEGPGFWIDREREFRQHATPANAGLTAEWYSTSDRWSVRSRAPAALSPDSAKVFLSLAREAAKGLAGIHHEEAWRDWLTLLRAEGYSTGKLDGTSYDSEDAGQAGEPPLGKLLLFTPHALSAGNPAGRAENNARAETSLVENSVLVEIRNVFNASADLCLELRSRIRSAGLEAMDLSKTSSNARGALIDEQFAAHHSGDVDSRSAAELQTPTLDVARIRVWMSNEGYDIPTLALELGRSERAVTSMLNGGNYHGKKLLARLANLMMCDLSDLFTG